MMEHSYPRFHATCGPSGYLNTTNVPCSSVNDESRGGLFTQVTEKPLAECKAIARRFFVPHGCTCSKKPERKWLRISRFVLPWIHQSGALSRTTVVTSLTWGDDVRPAPADSSSSSSSGSLVPLVSAGIWQTSVTCRRKLGGGRHKHHFVRQEHLGEFSYTVQVVVRCSDGGYTHSKQPNGNE